MTTTAPITTTRRYIAFDAAFSGPTGWAYQDGIGNWVFGNEDPMTRHDVIDLLRVAQSFGINAVVIEDCWLGTNPATHKKLALIQGRISQCADIVGMPWHAVPPSVWRASFRIRGDSKACKAQARGQAFYMTGHEFVVTKGKRGKPGVDETDMAEAVLLCDHANRTAAYDGLEAKEATKKGAAR